MGIITLLTDFGTADGYVAEMKGVLVTRAPEAQLVDASHEITPFDIEHARLTFARYWRRYPPGTVHLVVVDPGVGTDRAAIAVGSAGMFAVGPDNGVLSPMLLVPGASCVRLSVPAGASATFHGRDVFAPAAARLAGGEALTSLGEPFADPVIRRTPEPRLMPDGSIEGQVIAVDRFGNLITNLFIPRGKALGRSVEFDGRALRVVSTYAELGRGEMGALVGSSGMIEVVMREGRAGNAHGQPTILRAK